MSQLTWVHLVFLAVAILLEIVANIFLKYSDGFHRKGLGIAAIGCVLASFTALAQAVKGMELSIAYAVWGAFGVLGTVAMGWILFHQRLRPIGWAGMACLMLGMGLLKLA